MYRRFLFVALAVVLGVSASTALAQCGCGPVQAAYVPAAPSYTAYYAPEAYVTNYAPAPYVTYYAPAPYVTSYAPAPYVTSYAPAPYVTYYAPAAQPYVAYYGVPGSSIYGTPRVYVPREPVRNVLRAVLP